MKLHTNLTTAQVQAALMQAKTAGHVAYDVDFAVWREERSSTHPHGYQIQLGTSDQHSLPTGYVDQSGHRMHVRRSRNSGHGEHRWAATWHEWGWFIAAIFDADPDARWGQNPAKSARPEYAFGYASRADFDYKTEGEFRTPGWTPGNYSAPGHRAWTPPAYHEGGNLVIPTS